MAYFHHLHGWGAFRKHGKLTSTLIPLKCKKTNQQTKKWLIYPLVFGAFPTFHLACSPLCLLQYSFSMITDRAAGKGVKSYFISNTSVIKYMPYRGAIIMKSSSAHFTKTWHAYEIHFSQQNTKTQMASQCSSFVLKHLTRFRSLLNYPQVQNKSLSWSASIRKSVLNLLFGFFSLFLSHWPDNQIGGTHHNLQQLLSPVERISPFSLFTGLEATKITNLINKNVEFGLMVINLSFRWLFC